MTGTTAKLGVGVPSRRATLRRVVVLAAVGLVLALWTSGWADSPTDQLRGLFVAAAQILEDPKMEGKPEERMSAMRALVRDAFDFHEAARLSLGPDWTRRTPGERERFVRLFAELLERSFILGFTSRINVGDGIKVSYLGESMDGAAVVVRTTIEARSGLDLPFDFRMIERGDRWAVCDVAIDGVSLAANYRAQFSRLIQVSSYAELVEQIEAKVPGTTVVAVGGGSPTPRPPSAVGEILPRLAGKPLRSRVGEPLARAPIWPAPVDVEPAPAPVEESARKSPAPALEFPERRLVAVPLAEATAARPASAVAPGPHAYWIQLGAFKSVEAAARLASTIRRQQGPASTRRVTVETASSLDSLTRVRVGPFPDREAATEKLRELRGRGYRPFIAEVRH